MRATILVAACLRTALLFTPPSVSRRSVLSGAAATVVATPLALAQTPLSASAAAVPAQGVAAPASAASEFYSGMLAGAVQKTVKELALHPLDTAKARLQVTGGRRAVLRELFATPYDGLLPALLAGAPAASSFFAVKDFTKRAAAPLNPSKTESTLLAVVCANVAYWGIKNPSEVLKVRRQAGTVDDTLGAAAEVWGSEGLAGFYRSAGPNYAYSTPVDCTKFVLYEAVKTRLKAARGGTKLSAAEAAVGGAIAAATAQALATPLDVARVRIITANTGGVVDTISSIATDEGVGALYSGVVPKVARALASGAIQFSTYEATKEWATGFLARQFPRL